MTVLALNPTDAPRFEADTEVTPLQGHHLSSAISSFSHFDQQDSGGADSPVQDARAAGFSQRLSISNDGGGGGGGGGDDDDDDEQNRTAALSWNWLEDMSGRCTTRGELRRRQ